MSKKKLIMIVAVSALGALSFTVSFLLWPPPRPPHVEGEQGGPAAAMTQLPFGQGAEADSLRPKDQQLDQLVKELRTRLADCQRKERLLEERERRIQMAETALKEDARELEKLRMELVTPLRQLKEQISELQMTRIVIERQERANLQKTAAIYGGMKDLSAAQILQGMNEQEAVRILYYLAVSDERLAAKVLSKMDSKVAVRLTEMLKRIQEQEG